jgi:hypothetical protein
MQASKIIVCIPVRPGIHDSIRSVLMRNVEVDELRFARSEIYVMKHSSVNTIPGMLWRYLPMTEKCVLVARGADMFPLNVVEAEMVEHFLETDCCMLRFFGPTDIVDGLLNYRPVPGPITLLGLNDLDFVCAAKAWIWHNKHALLPKDSYYPPIQRRLAKSAMDHWARYVQDEQFLSHWLYPIAIERGMFTAVPQNKSSFILDLDLAACAKGTHNITIRPNIPRVF